MTVNDIMKASTEKTEVSVYNYNGMVLIGIENSFYAMPEAVKQLTVKELHHGWNSVSIIADCETWTEYDLYDKKNHKR